MQVKIEPCASCRRAPEYLDSWELFRCGNVDCEDYDIRWASASDWNVRQCKRLACRRADFEAGLRSGVMGQLWEEEEIDARFPAYLSQPPDGET